MDGPLSKYRFLAFHTPSGCSICIIITAQIVARNTYLRCQVPNKPRQCYTDEPDAHHIPAALSVSIDHHLRSPFSAFFFRFSLSFVFLRWTGSLIESLERLQFAVRGRSVAHFNFASDLDTSSYLLSSHLHSENVRYY